MSAPYPIPSGVITTCTPDPDGMFPSYKSAPQKVAAAKKVCAPCPYAAGCVEWALENDEEGVWGGTDEADRKAIHKARGTVGVRPSLAGLVRMGNTKIVHGSSVGVEYHRKRYEDQCEPCQQFLDARRGKEPPVRCPDCGKSLLPQSLRKHRRTACPVAHKAAS